MGSIPSPLAPDGSALALLTANVTAIETNYTGAGGAEATVGAGLVAAEADILATAAELGDYTGGGGAEASVAAGLVQAETDIGALETELGDYTGGGGAEASVAAGLVQAETDIGALETAVDAVEQTLTTVQGVIEIPLAAFRLATGAAAPAYSDGTDGLTLQDSKAFGFRLNNSVFTKFATVVGLLNDLDDTKDLVVHVLGARIGAADADAALVFEGFFQSPDVAYDDDADVGGNTSAFAAATKVETEETLTIAAANVPAAPSALTLTMAAHTTLDSDDLVVSRVWLEYTKKQLSS
jgi:hypothetical protein